MNIDYIIIGQGISGTLLSRSLMQAGKRVVVVDDNNGVTASKVASGIINPVTGKRLVKTWLIDELLPFAQSTYKEIETELNVSLITQCNILDYHLTRDAAQIFNERNGDEKEYLRAVQDKSKWTEYFRFNYGIGEIDPCLLVNIQALLSAWRQYLIANNALLEDKFDLNDCTIKEGSVLYKDIAAEKIIFCDGAGCADNPYFSRLPWSKDKGEALIASIPGLPPNNIYKQGINIVPWHHGLFWIGATHDWKFTDMQPSASFRAQTEEHLNYWLKLPYTIIDHLVAQRPVNVDRRPFVGLHPRHAAVGIFNGMGTKGCSVAPYFAHHFAQHLIDNTPIMSEVDISRFVKILTR